MRKRKQENTFIPSLPSATVKKSTPAFCHCRPPQFVFCHCEPRHILQTFTVTHPRTDKSEFATRQRDTVIIRRF